MPVHTYLFEAKSIQSFMLTTNRLKEIVGASELVEVLTGPLLDEVLKLIPDDVQFSRRGGGAFFAFSEDAETIDRLATLWPLCVRRHAPDLHFVQARKQGATASEAYKNAHGCLLADRNRVRSRLPQASPYAVRNSRTGEPAAAQSHTKIKREFIDTLTLRKLAFSEGSSLACRFAPTERYPTDQYTWPLNLSPGEEEKNKRDFPFNGEDRTIGLVHADGNSLGQLLMNLVDCVEGRPDLYVEIFRAFSDAVSDATLDAARYATRTVLEPSVSNGTWPARPIVLGGDDLTVIVRGDMALPFTHAFLAAFANESKVRLDNLKNKFSFLDLPERLTACAGIAYANASQPFHMLHGLAEGLCKHAKKQAKAKANSSNKTGKQPETPSSLTFHRVTTALIDDYGKILKRELTAGEYRHTLECYAIESGKGLPELGHLLELQTLLADSDLARGGIRELLGLVGRGSSQAERRYTRWREIMVDRSSSKLKAFDKLLEALWGIEDSSDLPYGFADEDGLRRSPLGDVVTLSAVNNQPVVGDKESGKEVA